MVRSFPQFSYHFCPFYNASVLTERLRFAILRTVQMSGNHRHQWPLTSLEKQDSWLSGLLYHVIFFSDLYISAFSSEFSIKSGKSPFSFERISRKEAHNVPRYLLCCVCDTSWNSNDSRSYHCCVTDPFYCNWQQKGREERRGGLKAH